MSEGTTMEKRSRQPLGLRLERSSVEARKTAAVVLEVLAGARTPAQAAEALSVSAPHYYKVETKAIEGLIGALEPRPHGRIVSPARESERLSKRCVRLEQDLSRMQALARASQRAIGLAVAPVAQKKEKGKRRKRPTVRALKAVKTLRAAEPSVAPTQSEAV